MIDHSVLPGGISGDGTIEKTQVAGQPGDKSGREAIPASSCILLIYTIVSVSVFNTKMPFILHFSAIINQITSPATIGNNNHF